MAFLESRECTWAAPRYCVDFHHSIIARHLVCDHKICGPGQGGLPLIPRWIIAAVFYLFIRSAVHAFCVRNTLYGTASPADPGLRKDTSLGSGGQGARSRNCSPAQIPGMWQSTLGESIPPLPSFSRYYHVTINARQRLTFSSTIITYLGPFHHSGGLFHHSPIPSSHRRLD